jgi:hypothetical protein
VNSLISVLFALATFSFALPAYASSHSWRFNEFYSSPDKQVQFIEMQEISGLNNETQIQDGWYASDTFNLSHTQLLGSSLAFGTADKKFLVGTESYAALPDVPTPDFIVPDGVIEPSGDTIIWWFYQTLTIPTETMPSDGTDALHLVNAADPELGFTVGPNSPTNYAGETGTVELPIKVPLSSGWAIASSVAIMAAGGGVLARRGRRISLGRA